MVDYWIYGLPVIASSLHALSQLYDDSVLEYFASEDAEELAGAIRRLHDDPERRAELAENGKLAERAHGWEVQRRSYLGTYEALLHASGRERELGTA